MNPHDSCVPFRIATAYPSTLGLATVALVMVLAMPSTAAPVDFGKADPSLAARSVADWVARSKNNGQASFVIIDKRAATMYVFDQRARLQGSSAILLGAARGDDTVPGIGEKPLAQVLPHEKTTPAGRFVAEHGRNTNGEDIVWVDYDSAVSMHRVRAKVASERRLQRLASRTASDNRISFGCINVPTSFYDTQLSPIITSHHSVVYVLPEEKSLQAVFGPGIAEVTASERAPVKGSGSRKKSG